MPRPGPRRALVNVRLEDEEIAWLDDEAARRQVSRSDVIRSAIAVARLSMHESPAAAEPST